MSRFIVFLIILVASVWVGLKIAEDPGYALFTYRQWSVEMPLWFMFFSLVAILLLFYYLLSFFGWIDVLVYRWKNWLRWRRKYKSYSKTNRGLVELIEGQWRGAEYDLLAGVEQSNAPLVNYLAAAKAAHEQTAYDKRDSYLRKAHQVAPHSEVAIGLTQAQLQFNQGQLEQALATLDHLRRVAPKNGLVLKLLERVYVHLADWKGLLKILPNLYKAKVVNAENLEKLELKVYQELLSTTGQKANDADILRELWLSIPKKFRADPELIYHYTQQLLRYPDTQVEVEYLINKALKKGWNKDLVRVYGLLNTTHAKKQLSTAENWLKQYPNQSVLLLTLGRLCMRCNLWGKARDYFTASIALEEHPEAYLEQGLLLEQLGEANLATQSYRDGLVCEVGTSSR